MVTCVEIVEGIGAPLLDADVLVLRKIFEEVGERGEGGSVDVHLLVQLEHLQEFHRVEAKELKLRRVDRHVLEVSKLPGDGLLPRGYSLSPHIVLKLQLFLLLLLRAVLLLEEDVLGIDLEGVLEYLEYLIAGDEGDEEEFSVDGGDGDGVVDEETADLLLYLFDIALGHLDEGLPEEEVVPVELGVEEEPVGCDEHAA